MDSSFLGDTDLRRSIAAGTNPLKIRNATKPPMIPPNQFCDTNVRLHCRHSPPTLLLHWIDVKIKKVSWDRPMMSPPLNKYCERSSERVSGGDSEHEEWSVELKYHVPP